MADQADRDRNRKPGVLTSRKLLFSAQKLTPLETPFALIPISRSDVGTTGDPVIQANIIRFDIGSEDYKQRTMACAEQTTLAEAHKIREHAKDHQYIVAADEEEFDR